MKPITHLLGDKVVAQRYLWFAERKLSELKMVMGLQNLEFGQRMYRLPNDSVEVFIQSYLGVDKIRIAAVAVIKAGITGDIAFDLPIIGTESYTIHGHRTGTWLASSGGTINYRSGIWDSDGNILYTGATTNLFVNNNLLFIETPLLDQVFSSNETFYYGIKFDYVSGQSTAIFGGGIGPSGHTIYIWNSITSSWDVTDQNLYLYFKKYRKVFPVGYRDAFVGQILKTGAGPTLIVASSSVATTRITTAITPDVIIGGFGPVTTLLG